MKTILIPTDYSEAANNALNYALEIAKLSKAKIVLFHAYHVPVPTGDIPIMMVTPAELEKENVVRIKKLEKEITERYADQLKVEHMVRAGFATDEILSVVKEKKIDLIVMGIAEESKLSRALLGSNAISIIKKTKTPVLVIPQNCRFKKIEKIVFACDYKRTINKQVLDELKKIVTLFKTKLIVLDVMSPEGAKHEKNAAELSIENALNEMDYSLYCPKGEDVNSEINSFVEKHKADWLVMAPQSYKFLEGVFHKSHTKQVGLHTHIPLLSIHN